MEGRIQGGVAVEEDGTIMNEGIKGFRFGVTIGFDLIKSGVEHSYSVGKKGGGTKIPLD